MKIEQYVVGSVATNCYFVIQENTKQILVIDPGASPKQLGEKIDAAGYEPVAVLLTHGHFDHIRGINKFLNSFKGTKIFVHENDLKLLRDPIKNCSITHHEYL